MSKSKHTVNKDSFLSPNILSQYYVSIDELSSD